jgi:hypothetical protein
MSLVPIAFSTTGPVSIRVTRFAILRNRHTAASFQKQEKVTLICCTTASLALLFSDPHMVLPIQVEDLLVTECCRQQCPGP